MEVLFHYRWSHKRTGRPDQPPRLERFASLANATDVAAYEISKYLLPAITTDFPDLQPLLCDEALQDIVRLECGEIDAAEWGGTCFTHFLTHSKVTFEHAVYGDSADWPLWSCTLGQYKAVLQGWRQFMAMPAEISRQLTVALPDERS